MIETTVFRCSTVRDHVRVNYPGHVKS